ncbi:MAG: YraN family protein [Proteobacteria bacterium]|nr:YraN family protein [Pseudomonadota bacterium]
MISKSDRQQRDAAGRRAEILSAWLLRLKGYRVLTQRFKTPVGEIDLIARRASVLAFIEVKARPSTAAALESLSPRQRRRIARAAMVFVQKRPELADKQMRFDLILVTPGQMPHHIVDAWRDS